MVQNDVSIAFLQRMHLYFWSNFNRNLKFSWHVFYSTDIGTTYIKIGAYFDRKTAFVMHNLGILALVGFVHKNDETPIGTSFGHSTSNESLSTTFRCDMDGRWARKEKKLRDCLSHPMAKQEGLLSLTA